MLGAVFCTRCTTYFLYIDYYETVERNAHYLSQHPCTMSRLKKNLPGHLFFPLHFYGHRWVENIPVTERAIEVWPKLQEYVEAVNKRKQPSSGTFFFGIAQTAIKDPLTVAKLQFFQHFPEHLTVLEERPDG